MLVIFDLAFQSVCRCGHLVAAIIFILDMLFYVFEFDNLLLF